MPFRRGSTWQGHSRPTIRESRGDCRVRREDASDERSIGDSRARAIYALRSTRASPFPSWRYHRLGCHLTAAREFHFTRVIRQAAFGSTARRRGLAGSHPSLPGQYLKSTTHPRPQPWLRRSSLASPHPSLFPPSGRRTAFAIRFETRREIIPLLHLARGSSSFLVVPPDLILECESRLSALSSPGLRRARGMRWHGRGRADSSLFPFAPPGRMYRAIFPLAVPRTLIPLPVCIPLPLLSSQILSR